MWSWVAAIDLDRPGPFEEEERASSLKEGQVLVSRRVTVTASRMPAYPAANILSSWSSKDKAMEKPGMSGLVRTSAPFIPQSEPGEPNKAMEEPGRTQTAAQVEERGEEQQEEQPLYVKQSYAEQLGMPDEGRGKKKKGRK